MELSRKIATYLTALAFTLTLIHAAVPHHHHGDIVCFHTSCTLHDDCAHDDGCTCTHGDGCTCGHHTPKQPLHSDDNCLLTTPYITTTDGHDLTTQLYENAYSHPLQILFSTEVAFQLNTYLTTERTHFIPDKTPLNSRMIRHAQSRRGPPSLTV